jgi:hypothetical protein
MVWDGTVWSIVSSPNAGTTFDRLSSVSCVSVSECVAVGSTYTGSADETLVMVWDGSVWSIVSSPNAGTSNDLLLSVSCVSVSECVAVGYTYTGSAYEALAMVWDGSVWSVVPSPNAGTIYDELRSVSCVSVSECVAVGFTDTGWASAAVNNYDLVVTRPGRSSVHGLNLRQDHQAQTARPDHVSLLAETGFITCFCKHVDLQVFNHALSQEGGNVAERGVKRSASAQKSWGRLVRGFEAA